MFEECGPCPVFAGYILAFALQLRGKKTRKNLSQNCEERILVYSRLLVHMEQGFS